MTARPVRPVSLRPICALIIAALMGVWLLVTAPGPAQGQLRPIRLVDCCVSGTETAMWVAYDQKIFQKHGLDPQLTTIPPPTDIVATQTGEVDLGTAPGSAIVSYASGYHNIVFVAGNVSKPVYFLMASPEIRLVSQLKGGKVGISGVFAPPDVAMRNALSKRYRLEAGKDYQVVPFRAIQDILPALTQGLIRAGVLSSPLYLQAQKAGMHILLNLSGTLPEANAYILANRTFAREHPEQVLAFLKAYVEAIDLARRQPSVAFASIARHTRDSEPEHVRITYLDYVDKFDVNMYPQALVPYQVYTNNEQVKGMHLSDILDFTFLKQLDGSGFLKAHGMALHLPPGVR